MKNFVLFYFSNGSLSKTALFKDIGMVIYYLTKNYNLNSKIVYTSNEVNPKIKCFRNIKLKSIKFIEKYNFLQKFFLKIDKLFFLKNYPFLNYLIKNAKKIDNLMLFHLGRDKFLIVFLYKLLNKNGKIYLKMDVGKLNNRRRKRFILKNYMLDYLCQKIDLISCETKGTYNKILQEGLYGNDISNKLIWIPNGFDEEYIIKENINIKKFEEKDNYIISVGRIGTPEKNNELLLEAALNIDLKDWKVLFVGGYTAEFKDKFTKGIKEYKDKEDKIILVGNIENKKELYYYYNRAKVFVLTSLKEGFPLVFPEALRFGNYILTTDVGGAQEITNDGKVGKILKTMLVSEIKDELLNIINGNIDLKSNYNKALKLAKDEFLWCCHMNENKIKNFFN